MAQLLGVKNVGQDGYGVGNDIHWLAQFDGEPTIDDIVAAQKKAGYHPAGYGGPDNVKIKKVEEISDATVNGRWEATFTCWASCD